MKTKVKCGLIILTAISFCLTTLQKAQADTFTVKIRPGNPGTSVQIKTENIQNPYPGQGGITVLMVHGMLHTGNSMKPLAQELFLNPPTGVRVKKVIVLNLPGRGGSGLPTGDPSVTLGDLNIDDYAECLIGALKNHKNDNTPPTAIAAHSMGGQITQVAQRRLFQIGKRLRNYNIYDAVFIASASPAEVPDPFLESGAGLYLLSFYTFSSPALGDFVALDPESFLGFFFTDLSAQFVPGTPTVEELAVLGYQADTESLAASLQTVGTAEMRPSVPAGAFAPWRGTTLHVMVGNNDPFNSPDQHAALYEYLTGDEYLENFIIIDDPYAVHDQLITDPGTIIDTFNNP